MPMEIRRFGVGHRRREGPPGTIGIEGQVIHGAGSGVIAELAFSRRGVVPPHSNPNLVYFIVIEGGGWVQVGDERARVQAGDAVVWPPGVDHGAWTEGTTMRALVVEFTLGAGDDPAVLDGATAAALAATTPRRPASRGEGRLATRAVDPHEPRDPDAADGEPR